MATKKCPHCDREMEWMQDLDRDSCPAGCGLFNAISTEAVRIANLAYFEQQEANTDPVRMIALEEVLKKLVEIRVGMMA